MGMGRRRVRGMFGIVGVSGLRLVLRLGLLRWCALDVRESVIVWIGGLGNGEIGQFVG